MLQKENVQRALEAVEVLCGRCPVCSPDCPVAIARRALAGLKYDLEAAEHNDNGNA
jgi:hypothetical protein